MNKNEALRMALEALEYPLNISHEGFNVDMAELLAHRAITSIKEALEKLEQEPVVWMYQDKSTHEVRFQKHMRDFVDHGQTYETPLYTTPPQRTWIGLTDEDKQIAFDDTQEGGGFWEFADAIEAKLKEKNT